MPKSTQNIADGGWRGELEGVGRSVSHAWVLYQYETQANWQNVVGKGKGITFILETSSPQARIYTSSVLVRLTYTRIAKDGLA